VINCLMDGRTIAFMVVERPTASSRFWSLVGALGLSRQGLWRAERVSDVTISTSSHNVAAHNPYASWSFRFSASDVTLCGNALGPVRSAPP
jgi:hypothetical protein